MSSPPPGLTFGHASSRGSGSPAPFSPHERTTPPTQGFDSLAQINADAGKLVLSDNRVVPHSLGFGQGFEQNPAFSQPSAGSQQVAYQHLQLQRCQSQAQLQLQSAADTDTTVTLGRNVAQSSVQSQVQAHAAPDQSAALQYMQQYQAQGPQPTGGPHHAFQSASQSHDYFAAVQRGAQHLRINSGIQHPSDAIYPDGSFPYHQNLPSSFPRPAANTEVIQNQFQSFQHMSRQGISAAPGQFAQSGVSSAPFFPSLGKNDHSPLPPFASYQQPPRSNMQAAAQQQAKPAQHHQTGAMSAFSSVAGSGMGFSSAPGAAAAPPSSTPWSMAESAFSLGPPFVPASCGNSSAPGFGSVSTFSGVHSMNTTMGAQQLQQMQLQLQQMQLNRQTALVFNQQKQEREREQDKESQQAPVLAFSQADINKAYSYCLDRGNGKFTRLIPADMLPPMKDVPSQVDFSLGLLVLPTLGGSPPPGCPSMDQTVTLADPPTKQQHSSSHKRPKIYCDKWVHEGVCAFTQQGCKFKHEMPMDKETQNSLGLFHGLPIWWKRSQAELQRLRQVTSGPDSESASSTAAVSEAASSSVPSSSVVSRVAASGTGDRHTSPAYTKVMWRSSTPGSQSSGSSGFSNGTAATCRPSKASGSATVGSSGGVSLVSGGEPRGSSSSSAAGKRYPGLKTDVNAMMARTQPRSAVASFYQPRSGTPSVAGSSCVWGPIAPPAKTQNDA